MREMIIESLSLYSGICTKKARPQNGLADSNGRSMKGSEWDVVVLLEVIGRGG